VPATAEAKEEGAGSVDSVVSVVDMVVVDAVVVDAVVVDVVVVDIFAAG